MTVLKRSVLLAFVAVVLLVACGSTDTATDGESVGTVSEALDSAHTRVIEECSQAMSGSWYTYNETTWPTATTYGSYAYISNDLGAWGKLLDNTYNGSTTRLVDVVPVNDHDIEQLWLELCLLANVWRLRHGEFVRLSGHVHKRHPPPRWTVQAVHEPRRIPFRTLPKSRLRMESVSERLRHCGE